MTTLRTVCLIVLGIVSGIGCARNSPAAIDAPSIPGIRQRMTQFIQANEIAGAVTCVVSPGGVVHLDAVGMADIAGNRAMSADNIVWIASMTKPITGTAVMMLVEQGKISLDDPVDKYISEFRQLRMADGRPARVTIRHLLTHTSGMSDGPREKVAAAKTLAELMPIYAAEPVGFEPGSRWAYCQSSINTAGRIVEVISGQSLPEFLEKNLFKPLGMKDTTFAVSQAQMPRLAKPYRKTGDKLEEAMVPGGRNGLKYADYPAANGGLFSTAGDYARFCQMILNDGTLNGRRYLKPESIKVMTSIHTGDLKTGFTDGNGWGIGWCVIRQPQGVTAMLSPGTFGHGGAYGTQAWIDPQRKLAYVLIVQRANFPNADASDVRRGFQQAAVEAISGR